MIKKNRRLTAEFLFGKRLVQAPVRFNLIQAGNPGFRRLACSFALGCGAIRLRGVKNLYQIRLPHNLPNKPDVLKASAITLH